MDGANGIKCSHRIRPPFERGGGGGKPGVTNSDETAGLSDSDGALKLII